MDPERNASTGEKRFNSKCVSRLLPRTVALVYAVNADSFEFVSVTRNALAITIVIFRKTDRERIVIFIRYFDFQTTF